ncbi:hypothetical protein ACQYZY_27170 [Pseudomonas aeruginosa]|jgi:hypothetical protein|uniref:hypothetical protein n=1 Tax=Pseudomonas aeruginosa TaxID=287 RepID=UPI001A2C324F|nr:hypothetical protein [Pseudomonas aeruginosa]EKV0397521.1 hypothetical protein [Pseudomonas aeruginosa]EKV3013123.1 hypothetical protein [Pseudomonas aeruginosa]MBH4318190.1 hypothetical protein [Pseudomonas aeruginosa]MBH8699589.1 hypothetical protein [Pseudomonas aeruginosa]WBM10746.1 hypothetical protein M1V28_32510 [Pseudomonas aeruginosa]
MQAFEEGKTAGKQGIDPFENPYPLHSLEGDAWGTGWLVGHDPETFGHCAALFTSKPTQH